jgi:hypothetical protein
MAGAFVAAAAAWISQGLITYTGNGGARIGLLPYSLTAIAVAVLAGAVVWWALRRGASAAPLALLLLVVIPWLPLPLPASLLAWSGRMTLLVWVAVIAALAAGAPRHPLGRLFQTQRPALLAGAIAFVIGLAAFVQVRPSLPAGDEPHYLVITQSLLRDRDLKIENNHRRGDYRVYFGGELPPDFRVRGRDGQIYSIHAPGLPAIVVPAFALGGYRAVVAFLLLLSAAGSALTWYLAREATGRDDAAWVGWAAVTLSATWVFHSFAVFPDGPGAVAVMTGVWALHRAQREIETGSTRVRPWFWHGAALALLPWMHTRFAALAGTLGALVLLRLGATPNPLSKAGAFLAAPIASALGWIAYFMVIYGTPDPAVPYGGEAGAFAFVPDGLAGLLFDQRFGLFAYAPVLLAALSGIVVMLRRRALQRSGLELLFVTVPYLLVVTYVAMWWGGTSAPARFFVPILSWMAIPTAVAWTACTTRTARSCVLGALLFTGFATIVLVCVDDGRLAFSSREEYARWLPWLNGTTDLGQGLPVWWRERETPLFRGIAIWAACAAAGWVLLRKVEGHPRLAGRARFATATAAVMVLMGTLALTLSWRAEGADPRAPVPAQLEALRRLSAERRLSAVSLWPAQRLRRESVPPLLQISPEFSSAPGGAGRNDRPLYAIPAIAAGEYRLRFAVRSLEGWLMLGIGRDQFALKTEPLANSQGSMVLDFPVDVRAIMVRGDEDARRNVRGLTLEPLRIVPPDQRLTPEYARRAVRYAAATVYFLDDRSFPEPEAFWVGGERDSSIVLQPATPHPAAALQLRNGAVENTVLIDSGAWRDQVRLGPGEERRIDVPLNIDRPATLIRFTTSAGFRPADIDPKSRDSRFLGVWVKVVN